MAWLRWPAMGWPTSLLSALLSTCECMPFLFARFGVVRTKENLRGLSTCSAYCCPHVSLVVLLISRLFSKIAQGFIVCFSSVMLVCAARNRSILSSAASTSFGGRKVVVLLWKITAPQSRLCNANQYFFPVYATAIQTIPRALGVSRQRRKAGW